MFDKENFPISAFLKDISSTIGAKINIGSDGNYLWTINDEAMPTKDLMKILEPYHWGSKNLASPLKKRSSLRLGLKELDQIQEQLNHN